MNIAPLIMVEAVASGGGVLNVVGTPVAGEDYGDTIVQTVPAVTVGYSQIVCTINDKPDVTVDDGTLAGTITMAAGYILHAFLVENITDSRTDATIRCWTDNTHTTPSGTNMIRRIFEVDAAAVDVAATINNATGSSSTIAVPITTTADDALGLLFAALSIDRTPVTGGGWTAFPGASDYNPYAYNNSLGTAGSKSATIGFTGGSSDWAAGAIAFVRA